MLIEKTLARSPEDIHWEALAAALNVTVVTLKLKSFEEIDALIEEKRGKIQYGYMVGNLIPRGNVLLSLGRFLDINITLNRFNKIFS